MQSCRCEAIVLGVLDYREADKIVTLFTLEHGKLKGLARGAKRSIRRFGGCLEPFALLTVQLAIKGGLSRLDGADVHSIHPRIRADLQKIGYAGYACETIDLLLPEGFANARLFRLLSAYLVQLDSTPPEPSDRRFFEINLLNILGYRPDLDNCGSCGAKLSLSIGGPAGVLLCGRCGRGGPAVSPSTIALLKRSLHTGRFGSIVFSPTELAEADTVLDPAIACHLSRPLKSLHFLSETG